MQKKTIMQNMQTPGVEFDQGYLSFFEVKKQTMINHFLGRSKDDFLDVCDQSWWKKPGAVNADNH